MIVTPMIVTANYITLYAIYKENLIYNYVHSTLY